VDSEALKTFLAVHRLQSFSKAARLLKRTQPAISRRVSLLERELEVPLFERGSGPLALSQAGRVLLPLAERALAALRDAEDAVRDLRTATAGPLSLVIVGTLAGGGLATALKRFAREHPKVEVILRTARSAEVSDLVRSGEATIGIRYGRDRSPDLDLRLLGEESLHVVCAPSHPLAGQAVRSLGALGEEQWLAFPDIPDQREISASHVFALFLVHGLGDVKWTPVDSLTAQKRLVEAGFGLALMPASSIAEDVRAGTVGRIRVHGLRASTEVFMVTRKGGYLSAAALKLRALLLTDYASAVAADDHRLHQSVKPQRKRSR
jgi:DNA-binding transcriptional LysR family regulator